MTAQHSGFLRNMRRLLASGGRQRRVHLAMTVALTITGAIAELLTIGAVLPVLAIAAAPESAAHLPLLGSTLAVIGSLLDLSPIVAAALLLVVSAIAATVIRLLLVLVSQKFVFGLMQDLVLDMFSRQLRQPYSWYVRQNSSAMLSGIDKIAQAIFGVVSPLILAATSAVTAVCLMGLLFALDPTTAIVAALSLGLIYGVLSVVARGTLRQASAELAHLRTARVQAIQESLGGIRDILLDGSQPVFEANLRGIEDRVRRGLVVAGFLQSAPRLVVEGAVVVLIALLAVWFSMQPGGILVAVPTLGAIAIGAQRLLPMIQSVYLGWAGYSVHADSIQDVIDLLDIPIEQHGTRTGGLAAASFHDSVRLHDVGFRYGDGPDALSGIDLTIRRGECVGIIGKTGSGKSTLVDVLMGLLKPTRGELLVDGRPLDAEGLTDWRAQVAHVPQAIFLIDASIAENIAFGSTPETIDARRVSDAARQAGLGKFIKTLPDGMGTVVGERGIRLSGGQRQRIGIARALYKRASLLILDEATSALDDETEAAVMESVAQLDPDLTIILIAHRLSTVAVCDRVYRLSGGLVVQEGSYEEVVGATAPSNKRSPTRS